MLLEERLNEILCILEQKRTVTVQELTEILNASESTIRRDLTVLHRKGLLVKVHGGATVIGINYSTKDDDVATRQDLNRDEKIHIARYAAELVQANDFVYIDAGTTTELLIDFLTEKKAIFVTNGINHAKKLVQRGFTCYLLGGELKLSTEAVIGSEAIFNLQKYNFTKGFWGTNGVSLQRGFSTPDINEAMTKKESMKQTKEHYILCDSSKFNQISPVSFALFTEATIITTNVQDEQYKKLKNVKEV
ncbi:MAG: Transcriptional regulator of sugar metabolism [Anaerocolumna sp.]|jgi:DeoR family fructose operon transcriptional repressor|nr:Transcriptional regulator of sugar metabolism [Anaerocolumna sp.]